MPNSTRRRRQVYEVIFDDQQGHASLARRHRVDSARRAADALVREALRGQALLDRRLAVHALTTIRGYVRQPGFRVSVGRLGALSIHKDRLP